MSNLIGQLSGKKTYLVAGAMVAYAIMGLVLGQQGQDEAIMLILQALAIAGLRHGVAK